MLASAWAPASVAASVASTRASLAQTLGPPMDFGPTSIGPWWSSLAPRCEHGTWGRGEDLVKRECVATRPNQLWVADLTYVATWRGLAARPPSSSSTT